MQNHVRRGLKIGSSSVVTGIACLACVGALPAAAAPATDWPTANHDPGASRYSPLAQITPQNVATLQPAWIYHMKPAGAAATGPSAVERQQAQAEQVGGPGQNGPRASGPGGPGGFNPFSNGRYNASETIPLEVRGIM